MNNILLLASKSKSRRLLLAQAAIPYVLLDQEADEAQCDWGMPLQKLVESIAVHKIAQVIMPNVKEGQELFVLTADTLTQNAQGAILGKPISRDHAHEMINSLRVGSARVGTAFCLDKKIYKFNEWQIIDRKLVFVEATCNFKVPAPWIDRYLEYSHALQCSGSMAIDDYGAQFLQSLSGSYTTILGLPMCQLRENLEILGFY